jgi:hypothetical protein
MATNATIVMDRAIKSAIARFGLDSRISTARSNELFNGVDNNGKRYRTADAVALALSGEDGLVTANTARTMFTRRATVCDANGVPVKDKSGDPQYNDTIFKFMRMSMISEDAVYAELMAREARKQKLLDAVIREALTGDSSLPLSAQVIAKFNTLRVERPTVCSDWAMVENVVQIMASMFEADEAEKLARKRTSDGSTSKTAPQGENGDAHRATTTPEQKAVLDAARDKLNTMFSGK